MPARPSLLDLCCKGGGASAGYAAAGFEVVGLDIEPQPHYPFEFHLGDALSFPLDGFDVVTGSPPCQLWSSLTRPQHRGAHVDLLTPLRARLRAWGGPYVLENVEGAPLDAPVWLCGSAFGLDVWRHRGFESNVPLAGTGCCHRHGPAQVYGAGGGIKGGVAAAREAMGIDWLPAAELTQAVPPAMTAYLGRQLLAWLHDACRSSPRRFGDLDVASPELALSVRSSRAKRLAAGAVTHGPEGFRFRLCGCGCGRGVPAPGPSGRWPEYVSSAHRQRAWRARRKSLVEETEAGSPSSAAGT